MKTAGFCFVVTMAATLAMGWNVAAAPVDFDFSVSYSGSSITGRLVGLNLDGGGNGTEVDPASVMLFNVPASVGLPASPAHPYMFVPHTFERSTLFSGTMTSTTPGEYGFQVSNYAINPASQNLLMIDSSGDVTLVFNFGASLGYEGGVATYGIQAEEDALWPAINSFVSFRAVSLPGDYNNDKTVDAADYTVWRDNLDAPAGTLSNDVDGGVIGQPQYNTWKASYGGANGTGSLSNTVVPEPTSGLLIVIAVASVTVETAGRCIKTRYRVSNSPRTGSSCSIWEPVKSAP
jgi:hypothetical protein